MISISSCYSSNPFGTVPNASNTLGLIVTFVFSDYFNFRGRSKYLSIFLLSFVFTLWATGTEKSFGRRVLIFCWLTFVDYCWLTIVSLLTGIRWLVSVSKSQIILYLFIILVWFFLVYLPLSRTVKFQVRLVQAFWHNGLSYLDRYFRPNADYIFIVHDFKLNSF